MIIRKAEDKDLARILEIYAIGREYMRKTGNPTQWAGGHPKKELLADDIKKGELFVGEDEKGVHFVFAFILGVDPTYIHIENGSWLSDEPYGTIHRIASDGTVSGTVKMATEFGKTIIPTIRIDTHEDNKTMQHVLEKIGYKRCGIIYLENGDPRIGYQIL